MVLRFFLLAVAFLLSCTSIERDSVCDEKSVYYNGCVGGVSSSSVPSSSSAGSVPSGGRGNYIANYRTTEIGSQTWMAENYDYAVAGSKCGGADGKLKDDSPVCNSLYGRLYNWATAMALDASCNSSSCAAQVSTNHRGICPSGWHIPSDDEWTTLTDFVGGTTTAGTKLKAIVEWNSNGNGTDDFGFTALPSGSGNFDGNFYNAGEDCHWWSASETVSGSAFGRSMYYGNGNVSWDVTSKSRLYSIRCVKD